MFKEKYTQQNNNESFEQYKGSSIEFKYDMQKDKEELRTVKKDDGDHIEYYNSKDQLVLVESNQENMPDESYESSSNNTNKEYDYDTDGQINKMRYKANNYFDRDGSTLDSETVGKVNFEFSEGRIIKANGLEVYIVHDDEGFNSAKYSEDEKDKVPLNDRGNYEKAVIEKKKQISVIYGADNEVEKIFEENNITNKYYDGEKTEKEVVVVFDRNEYDSGERDVMRIIEQHLLR